MSPAAGPLLDIHQSTAAANEQLPLAYRSRAFGGQSAIPTPPSPMHSNNIDYVNVNPNYRPPARPVGGLVGDTADLWQQQQQQRRPMAAANGVARQPASYAGVKLVCDIDQIFPVPEVSIYRLAKPFNGSHPDKLTKSETRIEKNPLNGLYHIQVISVLLDEEIETKYGFNEPVYFECLIGLTNLELSKYSDNKRSLVYRPSAAASAISSQRQRGMQADSSIHEHDMGNLERSSAHSSCLLGQVEERLVFNALLMMNCLLFIVFHHRTNYFSSSRWPQLAAAAAETAATPANGRR